MAPAPRNSQCYKGREKGKCSEDVSATENRTDPRERMVNPVSGWGGGWWRGGACHEGRLHRGGDPGAET